MHEFYARSEFFFFVYPRHTEINVKHIRALLGLFDAHRKNIIEIVVFYRLFQKRFVRRIYPFADNKRFLFAELHDRRKRTYRVCVRFARVYENVLGSGFGRGDITFVRSAATAENFNAEQCDFFSLHCEFFGRNVVNRLAVFIPRNPCVRFCENRNDRTGKKFFYRANHFVRARAAVRADCGNSQTFCAQSETFGVRSRKSPTAFFKSHTANNGQIGVFLKRKYRRAHLLKVAYRFDNHAVRAEFCDGFCLFGKDFVRLVESHSAVRIHQFARRSAIVKIIPVVFFGGFFRAIQSAFYDFFKRIFA